MKLKRWWPSSAVWRSKTQTRFVSCRERRLTEAFFFADGKADTPTGKAMKVRGFADPAVAKMSDDDLAGVIDKGKGKMPGYSKSMKPDEIKAMVAFVRSLAK